MKDWEQLELDFGPAPRKYINYEELYEKLKKGPITFKEIQDFCGLSKNATYQVITTLTLNYPVWSPARGMYKLCEASDYSSSPLEAAAKEEELKQHG